MYLPSEICACYDEHNKNFIVLIFKGVMIVGETGMEITGFYKLSCKDRLEIVKNYSNLDESDLESLQSVLAVATRTGVDWLENQISG